MRILRSTVMVRVGGGWVALDEFLVKNDPCRGMYSVSASIIPMQIIHIINTSIVDNAKNKTKLNIEYRPKEKVI